MYKVIGLTWLMIMAGIAVPFLSIVTYFIINQYCVWGPFRYTGCHVPRGLSIQTRSYVESMRSVNWFSMGLIRFLRYLWHCCLHSFAVFKPGMF